jgi:hypothetical protein
MAKNMRKIRDLLARDLDCKIEEIIKVDQHDEETVYREITEYVATDRIRNQYREVLNAIADAPADPHEGIGIWVSGFFGSGKSSFAKNLGYVLANREVLGLKAADLFKVQVEDDGITRRIDYINTRIPTEVIMFDVSVDRAVRKTTERITEVMYTVLLREFDYAEDFDIAELEIELEDEGLLEEFIQRCESRFGLPWSTIRKGAQKISRASAVLHEMDPSTYPEADSWAKSIATKQVDVTIGRFVDRVFELSSRRRPDKALIFIIDEVGQYVARSADKIEDLRALMEQLGKESKNRVKARTAISPVWVVVTSQEKLDEVVASIDSKRVQLARLQDRFKYRVDLAPADIREVATKRVLAKKEEAYPVLEDLYQRSAGLLSSACRLERTSRRCTISEEDFIQFYPYLPHFVELSIDIMSGIRLQPGAPKHLGGSNRTIIKQAYEMLVSDRTQMADRPIGSLVTLDLIFELVEGNLSTEKQKDISDIVQRFKDDPEDEGWASRVAKAICLLEYVRDLPRTEQNIAAFLVEEVGKPAPLPQVKAALSRLVDAKFVRNTEEGYKLQTAQEKNWETERRSYLDPKRQECNVIKREILAEVFGDSRLKTYRYKDLRSFRIGISVDDVNVGEEGQLDLKIHVADDPSEYPELVDRIREESRAEVHKKDIYWLITLTDEIHDLIRNLHASRSMVSRYRDITAKSKISNVELDCLSNEKTEVLRYRRRLVEKVLDVFAAGAGFFRGVSRDGSALGKSAPEILKKFLDSIIVDLYPKIELGALPLKGTEAEEILRAANLSALSQVFYGGDTGYNLVVKKDGRFVPNIEAEVVTEVLNHLKYQHSYGIKVTGKTLEEYFEGYAWDRDLLRLILAVLLRAGAIEITYEGRRFTSHQDPQCRVPLTKTNAFKASSFAPRSVIDLTTLTAAARNYEEIMGAEVNVEEEAIGLAFKRLAEEELQKVFPVKTLASLHNLPFLATVRSYEATLKGIASSTTSDCVAILASEGRSIKQLREQMGRIQRGLDDGAIEVITRARMSVHDMWPALETRPEGKKLNESVIDLSRLIEVEDFYEKMDLIQKRIKEISSAYHNLYCLLHEKRASAFCSAIEEIKGYPEWVQLGSKAITSGVIEPLAQRACEHLYLSEESVACTECKATISQMEADLAGLTGFKTQAIMRLQELTSPRKVTKRVRLLDFFPPAIDSEESVDRATEELRKHLYKLVAEGVTIVLE